GVNVKTPTTHDLIISPSRGCKPTASFSKEARYFAVSHCVKSQDLDEYDFIQIKPHHGLYYIYCPQSNFTIEGREEVCPNDVFTIPLSANFKINDLEFEGSRINLFHQEVVDPMFTVRTNWHLQPSINWTSLKSSLIEVKPTAPDESLYRILAISGGGIVSLSILTLTICIICKRRVIVTTQAEMIEMTET
ncbi:unnamed protein product, partial [Allacma fusca]